MPAVETMLDDEILISGNQPTSADYLPPSAPASQALASGTTSGTVDFGRATGVTTASASVTLLKPSGSSATATVADTGSVWRVSLSSLADGQSYTVILTLTATDGQACKQAALVTVAKADYLPPSAPATQALASGTTSGTVDFGRATGVSTASASVTLLKPSGSSATATVADTGSVWRVSLSSLADGEAYSAVLTLTATDGQICKQAGLLAVAAAAPTWKTLVDLDLTLCSNQSNLHTDGTYTVTINGVSVTMVVSHTTGTEGTTSASMVAGQGLVVTLTPTATTPPQNKAFSFDLSALLGYDVNPDRNDLCLEFTMTPSAMGTNNDVFTFELDETTPQTSSNPGIFAQLRRVSSTSYTVLSAYRQSGSATTSTGQTVKASLPTSFHVQLIGKQWSWEMCCEEASAVSNPYTPSIRGWCGQPSVVPADAAPSIWGTSQYATWAMTGNANGAAVSGTLTRIRLLSRQPVT